MFAVEGGVGRRGNVVPLHEAFGKVLGTFEHGTGLRGTDDGNGAQFVALLEIVVDAFYQRVFGAYHHHVHLVFNDELSNPVEIVGLDVNILAYAGRACVARCDIEFFDFLALCDFPGQSMLAASASQQ